MKLILKSCFSLSFCLLITNSLLSQTLSGIIKDAKSSEPLSFATILNVSKQSGTIANQYGRFALPKVDRGDSVIISFIGYAALEFVVLEYDIEVFLESKAQELNQFVIQSENRYLYKMLADCKPVKSEFKGVKTYYALQSSVNKEKVEVFEAYYNAHIVGCDIVGLDMKNGRVALAPFGNRFYAMSEGSRAMINHTLFNQSFMFPKSPIGMSYKKMRKHYDLGFANRYLKDNEHVIYQINYAPNDTTGSHFYGSVWVDSTSNLVEKIELNITHAKVYPFEPVGNVLEIKNVDMRIKKTFKQHKKLQTLKNIDFDYDITYRTQQGNTVTANTNAVIYAYDYFNSFILPQFHFSEGMYKDFREINAIPYNPWFWENMNEFTTPIMKANSLFVNDSNTITGEHLFSKNKYWETGFFEHPYVCWSEDKRITFRTDTFKPSEIELSTMLTEKYHLLAQIMLDINQFGDSIQVFTKTIYDPYESYYYYEFSKTGVAFLNMYFDLVEIHKRKLDEAIQGMKKTDEILSVYSQIQKELKVTTELFFKEVQHGTQKSKMLKWNAIISKEIGIDNLDFFHVYEQADRNAN